jgi:hypothetical protein
MVFPYSEEFKKLQTDRVLLAAIARAGDGQLVEPKTALAGPSSKWKGFFAPDDRTEDDLALRDKFAFVLAICVVCFLLDVAIRRVAIDWEKVFGRVRAVFARGPRKEAERIATMDRLMQRKQEVRVEKTGSETSVPVATVEKPKLAKFEPPRGTASEKGPVVAGSKEAIVPGEPKAAAPETKTPDQQGPFTNRLLEAKKRALKGLDEKKDDEKKDGESK